MDINLDWAFVIGLALLLALVCKLTSQHLNKKVDTMFDGMADTRTQRFFLMFDGQPKPISVTEAGKIVEENGGNLEIEGAYNQRPLTITVKTNEYSNKLSEDFIAGHCYIMPCTSKLKLQICKAEDEPEASDLKEVDSLPEKLNGIRVLADNANNCLKFMEKPDISEYIAHLFNSANVKNLTADGMLLRFEDEDPQGGESIIRIKTLFETQYQLATALEEV